MTKTKIAKIQTVIAPEAQVSRMTDWHPRISTKPMVRSNPFKPRSSRHNVIHARIRRWRQGVSDMIWEDGSRAEADRAEERRRSSDRYVYLYRFCIDDDDIRQTMFSTTSA